MTADDLGAPRRPAGPAIPRFGRRRWCDAAWHIRPGGLALQVGLHLVMSSGAVLAQQVINIPGIEVCQACTITLTEALRLGRPGDPAGVAMFADVAVDSRGTYAVASPVNPGSILIYDASGRFVRVVGRQGGGPGEFESFPKLRFGPGDSLHVVEEGTGRYSVFDESLVFRRGLTLPTRVFGFQLGPRGRIVAASPTGGVARHLGVQVFGPKGESVAAFEELSAAELRAPGAGRRHIALGTDGVVWTVRPDTYELRSYDARGTLRAAYRAAREWISGNPLPLRLDPGTEPPGQISALSVDDGLVWVFALVADAKWRPHQPHDGPPEPSAMFDTRMEVFDPRTGALVAHARVDHIVFPLRAGQVYGVVSLPDGDQQVQVWNVTLPTPR